MWEEESWFDRLIRESLLEGFRIFCKKMPSLNRIWKGFYIKKDSLPGSSGRGSESCDQEGSNGT